MEKNGRMIQVEVNGIGHEFMVDADTMLVELLRDRLRLTGAKVGCGQGHCGACTVIVDGQAVRSCIYKAARAHGKSVQTIEGLSGDEIFNRLQQAFINHGAVQCGFCTPGMLLAARALLDRTPQPTDDEIKTALKHNLCRCTGYKKILEAVHAAAEHQSVPARVRTGQANGELIGESVTRGDAWDKVNGRTMYTGDLWFEDMLHGAVLRSSHPHALIKGIDVVQARELPGVKAVLTAEDVPGRQNHGLLVKDWPVLAYDKVRYVGDAVAIVAADTPAQAQAALEAIRVEYDPLPVVPSPERALEPDAVAVHSDGNLLKHIEINKGDVQQGFAQAEYVLENEYQTPIGEHAFMEPEAAVAVPDTESGSITVYVGSQDPFADRAQIAASLDLAEDQVRVVHTPTGGAFGGKEDIVAQIHAGLLAQATGRPVRLMLSRQESLRVHPKRHATRIKIRTGFTQAGRIVAQDIRLLGDTGAYASMGVSVMSRAAAVGTGPYDVPNVHIECDVMYTNNLPAGAFRGFGSPQAHFAAESQLDQVAASLGMSPFEIRRIQALRTGSTTNTGQVLTDGAGLPECIDRVEAAVKKIREREPGRLPENIRRGWGVACGYKNVGRGNGNPDAAGAWVEADEAGRLVVGAGAVELGQGLETVLAQIVAQELGTVPDSVDVIVGDTARVLNGGPTSASRQTFVTGNAVRLAAQNLRSELAAIAAGMLDVDPGQISFGEGRAYVPDSGAELEFKEIVASARRAGRPTRSEYMYTPPATVPLGQPGDSHFAYGFACQAAQVEVDVVTGKVTVLRIVAAVDVGRTINPMLLEGQIEGATMMGLGYTLSEEFVMDNGIVLTDSLAKLGIPRIDMLPEMQSIVVEAPVVEGPYGAKGAGEVPGIPTAPAISNAVYDAVGVRVTRLPIKPAYLLEMLSKK